MDKEKLLELIVGYKKSAAVMAAYETGVFEKLYEEELSTQELGERSKTNPSHLSLLLLYLSSIELVECREGRWTLTKGMVSAYGQLHALDEVIRHEKSIFQRWMYPERIMQSLQADAGNRDFDRSGFSLEETAIYNQTMYGSTLKILAFRVCRSIRQYKNPTILEYGRSGNAVLRALKKTGYSFRGFYMWDEAVFSKNSEKTKADFEILREVPEQRFDIIFLYNTIHYYNEEILRNRIPMLESALCEGGRIYIVDLFFQKGDAFLSNVLLDWLTHGGIYLLTKESLEEKWSRYGSLQLIHADEIAEIHTSVCVASGDMKRSGI